jgi:thioredoxin 1
MSKPINIIGQQNFKEEVLDSKLPVLVDFWAPWCSPCQMMAPVLEALSEKFDGKLKIVKIDTDNQENIQTALDYRIQSIPNIKLFKDGEVIQEFIGYRSESTFSEELEEFIN